ncbi:histidine phosphatase family protein [Paenibacillus solisilvae]|uniref:Histidine phosphatase family protein n=1 Tax=Paenibacillus solisilvae TaxID=2486751 RepID=A0ABW0W6P6_9BACL
MKSIYLIRHCKAEGQDSSANLTPAGRIQAETLADFLADASIDYVRSSPWVRAVDTIRPFCSARGLALHTDERLTEYVLSSEAYPDWQDKLKLAYEDPDLKFTGGESTKESMVRAIAVVEELLARQESHAAIVTHGALMSLIIRHYDKEFGIEGWKNLSNPDVYKLIVHGNNQSEIERIWTERNEEP